MRTPYQNELHDLVTDEAVQVVETVRFAAQPCAAEPIRFGPEAGIAAAYNSGIISLASLTPATGIKPGTLALAVFINVANAGANNTLTVTGYLDAAGLYAVAAIAKTVAAEAHDAWITDDLSEIQYCPYVKVVYTYAGGGTIVPFITGEGARIGAVAS
jgi:hypothetical protein